MHERHDGLARNMRDPIPNAWFIEFTGMPIEQNDANTRAVFGEYVSVYDIQQAVIDKATVPIYYESRIAKPSLNEAELPKVDSEFEEITDGEEWKAEGKRMKDVGRKPFHPASFRLHTFPWPSLA